MPRTHVAFAAPPPLGGKRHTETPKNKPPMHILGGRSPSLLLCQCRSQPTQQDLGEHQVGTYCEHSFSGHLMFFSETVAGLPYSLWALSDASGWLGWVPWLVRLWGIQETRSLHLEISRFMIRVYVGPPLAGPRAAQPGGRVHTTFRSLFSEGPFPLTLTPLTPHLLPLTVLPLTPTYSH